MTKKYYFMKPHRDYSLFKIIAVIVAVLAVGAGTVQLALWLGAGGLGGVDIATALEDVEKAQACFQAGDTQGARDLLRPILARVNDAQVTPDALMLQAELEIAEGRQQEALALLERADTFKDSPRHPVIVAQRARLLESMGRHDEASGLHESVRDSAPPEYRAAGLVGLGRKAERENDLLGARTLYQQAVEDAAWNTPVWDEAMDALGRLNVAMIFDRAETPESKVYTVERGDNLTNIGIKLNTTLGLLTGANGIEMDSQLHLGQRLKYTPKDFRIIIERATCRLFLLDKDGIFKRYRVGLGKPGHETALGRYTIGNKQKDPTWFKPGAGPIPAGDPENELGTRWMPLVPAEEGLPTDLGIHGTIAPETIGFYHSRGCPRMLTEDVEELYDLVVRSTPVEIVDVWDPLKAG